MIHFVSFFPGSEIPRLGQSKFRQEKSSKRYYYMSKCWLSQSWDLWEPKIFFVYSLLCRESSGYSLVGSKIMLVRTTRLTTRLKVFFQTTSLYWSKTFLSTNSHDSPKDSKDPSGPVSPALGPFEALWRVVATGT